MYVSSSPGESYLQFHSAMQNVHRCKISIPDAMLPLRQRNPRNLIYARQRTRRSAWARRIKHRFGSNSTRRSSHEKFSANCYLQLSNDAQKEAIEKNSSSSTSVVERSSRKRPVEVSTSFALREMTTSPASG